MTTANEIERTNRTYNYFKDWSNLNKSMIGDIPVDNILLYQAFLAGWMMGRKITLEQQLEECAT